jgi:hypothetical protein
VVDLVVVRYTVITIGREVLVLVPLGYRRCYSSGSALFLFFPVCGRQRRIIQHSAVAYHPCRIGSRGRRQRLVALGRTARSCDHSSPAARNPRSSVRAVLTSHLDSPARLSLTGFAEIQIGQIPYSLAEFDSTVRDRRYSNSRNSRAFSEPESADRTGRKIKNQKKACLALCYSSLYHHMTGKNENTDGDIPPWLQLRRAGSQDA